MDNNNDLLYWKLGQMNAARAYSAAAKGKGTSSLGSYWDTQPLTAVVENTDATKVVITFTQALDESSVPATSAFAVLGKTVSDVAIASNVLTLTVSAAFIYGDGVHVQYIPPTSNPLQTSGNAAPSWYIAATNNVVYALPSANLKFDYFGGDGSSVPAEITVVGGYVTAIADRANDYDLAETGAGNTTHELSVAGVGRGALVLGGTSYFLRTIAAGVLADSTNHTIICVYSTTTADPSTFYMEGSTTSATPLFRSNIAPATNAVGVQHRDDASNLVNISAEATGVDVNDGNVHIIVFKRVGTSHQFIADEFTGTPTVKTMGTTTVNRMAIGALLQGSTTPSGIFTGKIFAVVGYEADNYETVIAPIARYYNISLLPITAAISYSSTIDEI